MAVCQNLLPAGFDEVTGDQTSLFRGPDKFSCLFSNQDLYLS